MPFLTSYANFRGRNSLKTDASLNFCSLFLLLLLLLLFYLEAVTLHKDRYFISLLLAMVSPCHWLFVLYKINLSLAKNLFMLRVRISSYGCTREVWRATLLATLAS